MLVQWSRGPKPLDFEQQEAALVSFTNRIEFPCTVESITATDEKIPTYQP